MLNLLDLRSIMGCQRALALYLRALFGQEENFTVYFSGQKAIIITSKHGTTLFFSPLKSFYRKSEYMPLGHLIILLKAN